MKTIHESDIELFAIEMLDKLRYSYLPGPDIAPDGDARERESYEDVLLIERLELAVKRINPGMPESAVDDAVKELRRISSPDLIANNET
ncbi:MAG: type I restriction endonuclease, partial [Bacteriovoracia bacterium]